MPEQAQKGVVTNTAQPLTAVGSPATELEIARVGVVTPVGSVTVIGTPATE